MDRTNEVRHLRWEAMPKERLKEGLHRRMVTGERAMLTQVFLDKGAVVPMHSHENEQLTWVVEGCLRFWIGTEDSEPVDVHAGEVLVLPSQVPHKAIALEDTLDVDIFTPPRQDWLDGTDSYLRGTSGEQDASS